MSSTQEKLDQAIEEILDGITKATGEPLDERDKPGLRQDLTELIDSAKREELEKLKKEQHLETENSGTMYYSVDVEVIDNRIAQLEQSEESK